MESDAEAISNNANVKVPIGALLLADELIRPQDLDFALEHQKHSKQLLGQILLQIGAVEQGELERSLKLQKAESD